MKAIVVAERGGLDKFIAKDLPAPASPIGRDVLIKVKAASVNPVDIKVRAGVYDDYPDYYEHVPTPHQIIGFDGAGIVAAVGSECARGLKPGDEVYYSGSPFRHGSNAELQLVDERSVARKPRTLDFVQSAALPLTWLTAYEALVDRLEIKKGEKAALLIINGAGGVGAVASQIARVVLDLPVVVTTASRPETIAFTKQMGATHVVNHREELEAQIDALKLDVPLKYVFITHTTDSYLPVVARVTAPFGKVCSIVQGQVKMYGTPFMAKSLTFVWELLSTQARYGTVGAGRWHADVLQELAGLVEEGRIKCHLTKRVRLSLAGLREAHALVESGKSLGKVGLGVDEKGDDDAFC